MQDRRRQLSLVFMLAVGVSALFGCKNKDYEKCLADAQKYEEGKLACAAMTNETEREACTSKNEVHKMTKQDCDSSYK